MPGNRSIAGEATDDVGVSSLAVVDRIEQRHLSWFATNPWAIDLACLFALGMVLVTDQTVLFFHLVFIAVTIGAATLSRNHFVWRAMTYTGVNILLVLNAVRIGDLPSEELVEIPLLVGILLVVFVMAQRRSDAVEAEFQAHATTARALDIKEAFLKTVGHELATPLTAAHGFAQINEQMFDLLDRDEMRDNNLVVLEQTERLRRLIDDLVTMARIRSGQLQQHPRAVQLGDLIDAAIRGVPTISGVVVVKPEKDHTVFVDRDHAERIIINYLTNAVKYGREPVQVVTKEQNGKVDVRVVDAGEGVPDALVPNLFDAFERGENVGNQPGTGLGLAIVRELALAAGGDAWYERLELGSCFAVSLPLVVDKRPVSA